MIAALVRRIKDWLEPPVLLTLDPDSPRWWDTNCWNDNCERPFKYRAKAGTEPTVHCPYCGESREVFPGVVARSWEC